jgi:hypothetical protein
MTPKKQYNTLNSRKGTTRPGIGVTASAVRSTPWMIQGWRPTSVTVHPASMAMKPKGDPSTMALSKL